MQLLIAYFLANLCAKNCRNRAVYVKIIASQMWDVFLRHSVYWQRYWTALQQRASAKLCGVVQGMELRYFRRPNVLSDTAASRAIELPDDDPVYMQCGSEFCVICNELATEQHS